MVGCLSINSFSRCFALQILSEIVLVGLSLPRPPLRGGRGAKSPDYFLQENLSRFPPFIDFLSSFYAHTLFSYSHSLNSLPLLDPSFIYRRTKWTRERPSRSPCLGG